MDQLFPSTPTQNNFQYKKQGPSPISLVRATRIFSKAKTLKKKLICHWPLAIRDNPIYPFRHGQAGYNINGSNA